MADAPAPAAPPAGEAQGPSKNALKKAQKEAEKVGSPALRFDTYQTSNHNSNLNALHRPQRRLPPKSASWLNAQRGKPKTPTMSPPTTTASCPWSDRSRMNHPASRASTSRTSPTMPTRQLYSAAGWLMPACSPPNSPS